MIAEADPQGQPIHRERGTCSRSTGPRKKTRAMGVEALRARADAKAVGAACTVMDEIGGGGQGQVAFDRACPSVTQKRPLVCHFPTARWGVALGHVNESTSLPESSKRRREPL